MVELHADRPLRDRLEALQQEVRALKHEQRLHESPVFSAERAVLVKAVTQLEKHTEKLQLHVDESRATLADARSGLQRLELALRVEAQGTLNSALIVAALLVVGGASVLLASVPAEICCAVCALVLGWSLGGRSPRLSIPQFENAVVWSWTGGLACLALTAFYVLTVFTLRNLAERWMIALLPTLLVALAAATVWLGARHRVALTTTLSATLLVATCSVPAAAELIRRKLAFEWIEPGAVAQVAAGLLAPALFLAFLWVRGAQPTQSWKPITLSVGLAIASWCCVRFATPSLLEYWRWMWTGPGSILALAVQLAVSSIACGLCLPSRARLGLFALGLVPLLWAGGLLAFMELR